MNTVQIKPGVTITKISMALYNWGKTVSELGVSTLDDAIAIYSEFKHDDTSDRELQYIKMGFDKLLEK